ncbi:hypothetical protein A4W92_00010 [Pseudomonas aeruginosa]|uniref:hypothetical protein n=1 Tax=Pseudomonas aeruginosa TaxID=287 RepID=UPI0007A94099|nr:hypothetical protein [Pseudomonas aeruginosa]AMX85377.1 hypothetical protein A4W92_00010 [Pseudomonas aeruginosa]
MKQLKQLFSLGKREAVIGGSLLMTSGLSMAAEGDIDTTKALAYIAGGLTAAAAGRMRSPENRPAPGFAFGLRPPQVT